MNGIRIGQCSFTDIVGAGSQKITDGGAGIIGGDGLNQLGAGCIRIDAEYIPGTQRAVLVFLLDL